MIKTKDGRAGDDDRNRYHLDGSSVPEAEPSQSATSPGAVASIIVSTLLVLVLIVIASGFLFVYGKRNPGGMAERIAMRMESSYKRFGGENLGGGGAACNLDRLEGRDFNSVDLENKHVVAQDDKDNEVNRNNNNSITISF